MYTSTPYILISILAILIMAVLVFFVGRNRQDNHLTPLPVCHLVSFWQASCLARTVTLAAG
jgi:lipopolysaccharide export LptBFGC system permease protein LptF